MENLYDSSYKSATGTSVLSMVMRKVYGRMFLALVVTALTSLYVASSPPYYRSFWETGLSFSA